jgi:hypothetical protein
MDYAYQTQLGGPIIGGDDDKMAIIIKLEQLFSKL